jgi:hypothetical protein
MAFCGPRQLIAMPLSFSFTSRTGALLNLMGYMPTKVG